jgi:hypothetical protein
MLQFSLAPAASANHITCTSPASLAPLSAKLESPRNVWVFPAGQDWSAGSI